LSRRCIRRSPREEGETESAVKSLRFFIQGIHQQEREARLLIQGGNVKEHVQKQLAPEPLSLESAIDRKTPEEKGTDLGIPPDPGQLSRSHSRNDLGRRERVVTQNVFGLVFMNEHEAAGQVEPLVLTRKVPKVIVKTRLT